MKDPMDGEHMEMKLAVGGSEVDLTKAGHEAKKAAKKAAEEAAALKAMASAQGNDGEE